MGFEDRLREAAAARQAHDAQVATAAAVETAAVREARETAQRLLPDVAQAARALAALPPWPVPADLDAESIARRLEVFQKRRIPSVPQERRAAGAGVSFELRARFESERHGFRGKQWRHRFVGWRMELRSGLKAAAEVDVDDARVTFLVDIPVGGRAVMSVAALADAGITTWGEARDKEWSAPGRSVRAADLFESFLDQAAQLVVARS